MTVQETALGIHAVGAYTNIGRLARTIVLRWEYVRGSTLFAVWNLTTSNEDARKGIFSPWRDLGGAFSASGTNTFAIKLSYWFTP